MADTVAPDAGINLAAMAAPPAAMGAAVLVDAVAPVKTTASAAAYSGAEVKATVASVDSEIDVKARQAPVATDDSETEAAGIAASIDSEIYEIFVEEISEIRDNFKIWIPEWMDNRDDNELLVEIRRAYHTCKGSSRMVGGLAMGDYAWVHEDMLNQVMGGQLPRNDNCAAILNQSLSYIDNNLSFFLDAVETNEATRYEISRVENFVKDPEATIGDFAEHSAVPVESESEVIPDALPQPSPDEGLSFAEAPLEIKSERVEPEPVGSEMTIEPDIELMSFMDAPVEVASDVADVKAGQRKDDIELMDVMGFSGSEPVVVKTADSTEPLEPIDFLDSEPAVTEAADNADLLEPLDFLDSASGATDQVGNTELSESLDFLYPEESLTEEASEVVEDNGSEEPWESIDFLGSEPVITEAEVVGAKDNVEPLEAIDFLSTEASVAEEADGTESFETIDFMSPEPFAVAETETHLNTEPVVADAGADEVADREPTESVDLLSLGAVVSGAGAAIAAGQSEALASAHQVGSASEEAEPPSTVVDEPESDFVEFSAFDDDEERRIVWEMFREELPDQLLAIDQQMQSLTAEPGNIEVLKELERELHTLKGSSRMARLNDMGDAAHEAEELLEGVRRERGRVLTEEELVSLQSDIDLIGVLAEQYSLSGLPGAKLETETTEPDQPEETVAGDQVKVAEEAVAGDKTEEPVMEGAVDRLPPEVAPEQTYESYLERILFEQAKTLPDLSVLESIDALAAEQAEKDKAAVAPSLPLQDQEQVRLSAAYLDKMVESSNALNIIQNAVRERLVLMGEDVGEFGRTASRLKQLLRSLEMETETQIHAGHREAAENNRQNEGFDPLEMDEYSEIQRLSRALAESLNDLVNIEGDLTTHLRTVDKFVGDSVLTGRELHQNLLTTRLVEVSAIIPRLRRIMRQVASEFGRKVSFEIDGEALKLDRYLLQRMTAPIEHLLRNAVFHGIETPDERIALGKGAEGGILLEVDREDTEVVFRISDDGRGLDKEKIRAKAIEQGLIGNNEQLSDQDIYKLVLRSGFTTVDEANQVAGRGVGMDVVNSEIKALGGSLLIDSDFGSGSEFTVRLPFTMAANPVLFVLIQKQQYALPLGGVQGLTRLAADDIKQHLGKTDAPLILDEQPYTLQYLGDALGHPGRMELRDGDMHVIIYMSIGGHHIAWLVDAINGRHEVVLQSLGALFKTCRFYSAATVTSDGDVIMVPDMLELAEQAMAKPVSEESVLTDDEFVAPVVRHENPHILIVDDSITVRKVTEKLLVTENFVVDTAKDGLEALEKLTVFEADLVLLDIEMPRMDGFEVLSAVRNEAKWKGLPVIMISSRTAEKHLSHAKELGANDFLGKPYQNQDLLEHIFKHLDGYQSMASGKSQTTKESVS